MNFKRRSGFGGVEYEVKQHRHAIPRAADGQPDGTLLPSTAGGKVPTRPRGRSDLDLFCHSSEARSAPRGAYFALRARETGFDSFVLDVQLLQLSVIHRVSLAGSGLRAIFVVEFALYPDEFHVTDISSQPKLLGFLYSVSRGNNLFLKLSAIETLTRSWDSKAHTGLQVPHDAQTIKLDYNLTMPDKAATHIEGILDAHAIYCGLPSVRFLCTSGDVLSRLVWVSAGVPRDALSMFALAMTKGATAGRSLVSVPKASSPQPSGQQETQTISRRTSLRERSRRPLRALERVKDFCIEPERKNAFLTEFGTMMPSTRTF